MTSVTMPVTATDAVRRTGLANLATAAGRVELSEFVAGPVSGDLPLVEVLDRGVF